MGRTVPTGTMQVYRFERDWCALARAPRRVDREAFAELVAFAHFHAAALAHAASPYEFEMILLTMLVGLVRRAETLRARGILPADARVGGEDDTVSALQAQLRGVMQALRMRLASRRHELVTFGRALRQEDQDALLALLAQTHAADRALVAAETMPTDAQLLTVLVSIMRRIRRLEECAEREADSTAEAWRRLCAP